MLKQILLGAAMLATSSFATFSQFPVPQAKSGEAKLVHDFTIQDKWKELDVSVRGRYVPIQNLELWLDLPFAVVTRLDGKDADQERMMNLTYGARYQIIPTVAAFLDVSFPTGKYSDNDGFEFYFGGQYSQDFGKVALGTELGLSMSTEGKDKIRPPMQMKFIAELDPNVSEIIAPYVGFSLKVALGNPKNNVKVDENTDIEIETSKTSGDIGIFPYIGATYAINNILSLDLNVSLGFGKDYLAHFYGNKKMPITIEATLVASF